MSSDDAVGGGPRRHASRTGPTKRRLMPANRRWAEIQDVLEELNGSVETLTRTVAKSGDVGRKLERRLEQVERRVDDLRDRSQSLDKRMEGLKERSQRIDKRMEESRHHSDGVDTALTSLTQAVASIDRVMIRGTSTRMGMKPAIDHIQQTVESIVRLLAIDVDDVAYPQRLTAHRFRMLSHSQEDGLLLSLFREVGTTNRRLVELGCGDNGGNSGFLATELGWSGLMVDGSAELAAITRRRVEGRDVTVVDRWIKRDEVDDLLSEHDIAGEVDLLSIDIDGNDYWVWEALSGCSPRVVVVEYNTALGSERGVVVPYDPGFVRDKSVLFGLYYGASLTALTRLAKRKGYRLVAGESVNAFFLRDDVAPDIPGCPVSSIYRLYAKDAARLGALPDGIFDALAEQGLELAEIPEDGGG